MYFHNLYSDDFNFNKNLNQLVKFFICNYLHFSKVFYNYSKGNKLNLASQNNSRLKFFFGSMFSTSKTFFVRKIMFESIDTSGKNRIFLDSKDFFFFEMLSIWSIYIYRDFPLNHVQNLNKFLPQI
jgi:hypothetical protein